MAKKQKKPKQEPKDWEPNPEDAINLSALRIYSCKIEELSLLVYRTDEGKERPSFKKIQRILARAIRDLRDLGERREEPTLHVQGRCPDADELGPDGFCYPPGTFS